jgi:cyclin D2
MSFKYSKMKENFLYHDKIIESLLKLEEYYTINAPYFINSNNKVNPSIRQALATWMLEVCEEQNLTDQIFSLSMNLFDRLMIVLNKVEKYHLQLIGTVCLFISSKLKSVSGSKLDAYKLVEYTNNSITLDEIIEWELIILEKLKWDISPILPNDFIEVFINRIQQYNSKEIDLHLLKKHCNAFTALCSTDLKFSIYPPSMIASACLLLALEGISLNKKNTNQDDTFNIVLKYTNIDIECLLSLKESIDDLLKDSFKKQTNLNNNSLEDDYDLLLDYKNTETTDANISSKAISNDFDGDYLNIEYIETKFDNFQEYSYENLIQSLSISNDEKFNSPSKILQFSQTQNYKNPSIKKKNQRNRRQCKKSTTNINSRSSSSNSFNSSNSSGISSNTSCCYNYVTQNTPPLAKVLPLPTFDRTIKM